MVRKRSAAAEEPMYAGVEPPPEVEEYEPVAPKRPARKSRKRADAALRAPLRAVRDDEDALSPVERYNLRRRQQLASTRKRKRPLQEVEGGTFRLVGTALTSNEGGNYRHFEIGEVVELTTAQATKLASHNPEYIERVELDEDGEVIEVPKPNRLMKRRR